MKVEVDQSGKIEHLDTPTIVALANDDQKVLIIKPSVKRRLMPQLYRSLIPKHDLFSLLFALVVSFLIDEAHRNATIIIDEEYTGKNRLIAEALTKILFRRFGKKWRGSIRFANIGKHSSAHRLAWELHRKKQKQSPLRHLTERDILKIFKEFAP